MTKKLTIGSESFDYPIQGTGAGHGEDASRWAEAVSDALLTVQGPNDILPTSAILSNNQTSSTIIPGLNFNLSQVRHVNIEYYIERSFSDATPVVVESGIILGTYTGSDLEIIQQSTSDSGVDLTARSDGQFEYTSSDLTNNDSIIIKFKAKTIDV